MRTAAGTHAMARSPSELSRTAAVACASRNENPVDMWTTQARCPQVHRFNNRNRAKQTEKHVTHVRGQKCHPCSRLHSEARPGGGIMANEIARTLRKRMMTPQEVKLWVHRR